MDDNLTVKEYMALAQYPNSNAKYGMSIKNGPKKLSIMFSFLNWMLLPNLRSTKNDDQNEPCRISMDDLLAEIELYKSGIDPSKMMDLPDTRK